MKQTYIRENRQKFGVSQAETGVSLGRSQVWVSLVERGLITLDDDTAGRVIVEIEKIAKCKGKIFKAQREATTRVQREFENPKLAGNASQ